MKNPFNKVKAASEDTAPPAHPASTVILLRPTDDSFEVLLLLRAKAIKFAGGNWVFPGGRIDAEDYKDDHNNEEAAARVAAARESHEEAGLSLNSDDFTFFSHWTTPLIEKKRFSTWFLWGQVNHEQSIVIDDGEIVDHLWLTPAKAIEMMRNKELKIMPPTYLTLYELAQCKSIEDVKKLTQSREIPRYFPNLVMHEKTPGILLEKDDGYKTGEMDHQGNKHRVVLSSNGWQLIQD